MRFVKKILFTSYVILLPLLGIELVLRLFDPLGISYFSEAERYFTAMLPDRNFAYIHSPGYKNVFQGVEVEINQHGFRAQPFSRQKPADKKRILILGDSIVFGWGVAQDSIFPALLNRAFNDSAEVIPLGVGSWNTRTEYEYFRREGIQLNPDAVVWVLVSNDIEPKKDGYTAIPKNELFAADSTESVFRRSFLEVFRPVISKSHFVATIYFLVYKQRKVSQQFDIMLQQDSPAWRDAEKALRGMVELCQTNNIPLICVFYGSDTLDYNVTFKEMYSTILDSLNVPYYSMPQALYQPEYQNSVVDPHPNTSGHHLVAETMSAILKEHLPFLP